MFDKLDEVKSKWDELNSQLSDPSITSDPHAYRKIAKEHAHLSCVVSTYDKLREIGNEIEDNQSLLSDDDDLIRQMAKDELSRLEEEKLQTEEDLKKLLIPTDPLDEKNIVLEVRAGTGGEEAALFAADLFRMYLRYCESKQWKVDLVSSNETDHGGYREVVALIEGEDVYSYLKYEAGTHRVQRIPTTESQGRIHTSAVTVAILPEVEDIEIDIPDTDLRRDVYRASGAGGQHVNKTESAVRYTHIPTGLVVTCQDEKSQKKNEAKALKVLKSRLYELKLAEQQKELASERLSQVGSGDRSERIRTYNYPQNRISDHRINLTVYQLDTIINGDLAQLVEPLQVYEQAEKLRDLEAG